MAAHARFRELVLPHLDAGYNLARWLARDVNDAQDIVQDACLRALRYIDALQGRDARAWFLTIVRHAFYDWRQRNHAPLADDGADPIEEMVDPTALDPETAALQQEQAHALVAAVARLPLPFREVLLLRELEDLSYKEIARVVEAPVGTVMSRLARARALLRASTTPPAKTRAARSEETP